jgi:hypothetical protein
MTMVQRLPRQARGASTPASRRASAIDCPAGTNSPESTPRRRTARYGNGTPRQALDR